MSEFTLSSGERIPECMLAIWFTPDAIREHYGGFDGAQAQWVASATDTELADVGLDALQSDSIWSAFHDALSDAVHAVLQARGRR